jgi:hypothetical protein
MLDSHYNCPEGMREVNLCVILQWQFVDNHVIYHIPCLRAVYLYLIQ